MPYVFNTSFYVHPMRRVEWMAWIENCIDGVAKSLGFDDERFKMYEVVSESPDGYLIFSLQWSCKDITGVGDVDEEMSSFLKKIYEVFGEEVTHFSSIMKRV